MEERHVMEERHGGNLVQFLMLRKLFYMVRQASTMREKRFQFDIEEILPHRERHGGSPWRRHGSAMSWKSAPWRKFFFYCNVEETLPHEAPCEHYGKRISMSNVDEKKAPCGVP